MNEDESHLKGLMIGHYVAGGLSVLFGCIPLIYVGLGLMFVFGGEDLFPQKEGQEVPPALGWLFVGIGAFLFVLAQALAVLILLSGKFIKERKNYTFIFVMACVSCLSVPIGTILGVFTIVVLSRDSVKRLFGKA